MREGLEHHSLPGQCLVLPCTLCLPQFMANNVPCGEGRAYLILHRPQDTPHMLLRHSEAQLLAGLPQGRVYHILVSWVTFTTWKTAQAQGDWALICWGHGGVGMATVAEVSLVGSELGPWAGHMTSPGSVYLPEQWG